MDRYIGANRNAARAFTLLETLVSLGVFAIIMMIVGSIFFSMYRDWKRQKDYMNVLQDSYQAVEMLSSDIRQATDIDLETNPVASLKLDTPYLPALQSIWIWRGTQTSIANENNTWGYKGFLYWGRGNLIWWVDPWGLVRGAWQYRNVLCRFVTGYTNVYNATTGLVYLNLTLRPQPDAPEGPLNRNYTVNTVIRRRN